MIVKIPVLNENDEIQTLEVEADDIYDAMNIVRKRGIKFIDSYTVVCWYNGDNID